MQRQLHPELQNSKGCLRNRINKLLYLRRLLSGTCHSLRCASIELLFVSWMEASEALWMRHGCLQHNVRICWPGCKFAGNSGERTSCKQYVSNVLLASTSYTLISCPEESRLYQGKTPGPYWPLAVPIRLPRLSGEVPRHRKQLHKKLDHYIESQITTTEVRQMLPEVSSPCARRRPQNRED